MTGMLSCVRHTLAMRKRTPLGAAAAAVLVTAVLATPAHAGRYGIDDPADATASLTDIYGLQARYGSANLVVKVRFNELRSDSAAGVTMFIDTDRERRGAEFVLNSGLGEGTDFVLTPAEGWRASDEPIRCDYDARPKWNKDLFWARISRGCLDDASAVRVTVRMIDQADGSHQVVDWAPRKHRWSLTIPSALSA